jgi:hypothetical protein
MILRPQPSGPIAVLDVEERRVVRDFWVQPVHEIAGAASFAVQLQRSLYGITPAQRFFQKLSGFAISAMSHSFLHHLYSAMMSLSENIMIN